jgi:signal transduction histidine kinase
MNTRGWSRVLTLGALLAYAMVSATIVTVTGPQVTTYAQVSAIAATVSVGAGLVLIVAGALAWIGRSASTIGVVTMLLGVIWYAPLWAGWQRSDRAQASFIPADGGPVARGLALAAAPFITALLAHLTLAVADGRRRATLWVGVCYAVAVFAGPVRVLVYDPFYDPRCWMDCTANGLLLVNRTGLASALHQVGLWFGLGAGSAIAVYVLRRLLSSNQMARRLTGPILLPAAAAALCESVYAAALLVRPDEDPAIEPYRQIFVIRAAALGCLAFGVGWTALRGRQRAAEVARLAESVSGTAEVGSLRTMLAGVLGDDGFVIAYWSLDAGGYIDAAGVPVELRPAPDQVLALIRRGGEPIAAIAHDRVQASQVHLSRSLGPAARIAIDNERLRATVLAQLAGLRSSRTRIVEAADNARRCLERDLHDGAQYRLTMVIYELLRAAAEAGREGDADRLAHLNHAVAEARAALGELRDIAQGIFPAVLHESGLGPALETLADRSQVPISIERVPIQRKPALVEHAAYAVVATAVMQATDSLDVCVDDLPGLVVVAIGDLDRYTDEAVADRIGALGGVISFDRHRVRAEIPCA